MVNIIKDIEKINLEFELYYDPHKKSRHLAERVIESLERYMYTLDSLLKFVNTDIKTEYTESTKSAYEIKFTINAPENIVKMYPLYYSMFTKLHNILSMVRDVNKRDFSVIVSVNIDIEKNMSIKTEYLFDYGKFMVEINKLFYEEDEDYEYDLWIYLWAFKNKEIENIVKTVSKLYHEAFGIPYKYNNCTEAVKDLMKKWLNRNPYLKVEIVDNEYLKRKYDGKKVKFVDVVTRLEDIIKTLPNKVSIHIYHDGRWFTVNIDNMTDIKALDKILSEMTRE